MEQAILRGFDCWRCLKAHDGGLVSLDLDRRAIETRPLRPEERAAHTAAATRVLADGTR